MRPSISLVVPTLNAEGELPTLLDAVAAQDVSVDEVLVVDSSSDDGTVSVAEGRNRVRVMSIERSEFDHGATRHMALLETFGDFVLFLTQDAVPLSSRYVRALLEPFEDEGVAMASARQRPKSGARRFEQLVREFNYPPESNVRSEADVPQLGIKAFFASDACSAYRRSAYLECGGFARPCNTNEDMLMAAAFIHSGWKVAYAAAAEVAHSHNLSAKEQYQRNREVGRFLAERADALGCGSEVSEGGHLVKSVAAQLAREREFGELAAFGVDCAARLLGNRAGRRAALRETRGFE